MGETTVWGYAAMAAAILGFAFGIWRYRRREAKKRANKKD